MPTPFDTSFTIGSVIEPSHIQQYAPSIQAIENGTTFFASASGGPADYAITMDPTPPEELPVGYMVHFEVATTNDGPATLSVNGGDDWPLVMNGDQPLTAGTMAAGQVMAAVFDGAAFQLMGGYTSDSIDAAKIADGSVSNAEYQYLNGLTSGIQSQLDARAPLEQPVLEGPVQVYSSDGGASFLEFSSDAFPLYSALARVGWEGGTGVVFSAGYYHLIIRTVDGDIDLQPGGTGRKASINGSKIWHEGNDGTGSGLDADKVDGKHAGTTSDTVLVLPGSLTKGDILVFDGSGVVRLPVGANGEVLTVDSSEPTGLKWA